MNEAKEKRRRDWMRRRFKAMMEGYCWVIEQIEDPEETIPMWVIDRAGMKVWENTQTMKKGLREHDTPMWHRLVDATERNLQELGYPIDDHYLALYKEKQNDG